MGPIIRRPMQHNRIRPHSNSTHGGQRRRSICHNSRWRENRLGNPTKAKRQCWCGCICGYSPSQTRFCYRGRSGRHGGVQSVVQLCIWSDDQCDWWTQLLERRGLYFIQKEVNCVISANGYGKSAAGCVSSSHYCVTQADLHNLSQSLPRIQNPVYQPHSLPPNLPYHYTLFI